MSVILNRFHKCYIDNDNEVLTSVLAMDAATMNPCGTGKSGCVAYQIQPVKPGYKSCIIHISLNETSRFTLALIDDAHSIIKLAEEAKFDIKILTTDADNKTNPDAH